MRDSAAIPQLSATIRASQFEGAVMRIGRVIAHGPDQLSVEISDSNALVNAACLFNQYQPALGDTVAILGQGASWLVLGSFSGPLGEDNALQNSSFEDGADNVLPPGWTLSITTGTPTFLTLDLIAISQEFLLDGPKVGALRAATTGAVVCDVLSAPISVSPGETWGASAYFRPSSAFAVSSSALIQMYISLYDGTTFVSEQGGGDWAPTRGRPWSLIRAGAGPSSGVIIPDSGVTNIRIKFHVVWGTAAVNDSIYFDHVAARRIA